MISDNTYQQHIPVTDIRTPHLMMIPENDYDSSCNTVPDHVSSLQVQASSLGVQECKFSQLSPQ